MTDPKQLVREWAETVVVIGAALATVSGLVWAFARRNIDVWIVGALTREQARFREVSAEVWKMDIERWEQAAEMAKETYSKVKHIEVDVTHLRERDREFGQIVADVSTIKSEIELMTEIARDLRATREAVARIEGELGTRKRHRSD